MTFQIGHPSYLTEESKKKIGAALKGRKKKFRKRKPHSVETRKKLSESAKRRGISVETRQKMIEGKKNSSYYPSYETRVKLGRVHRGSGNVNWKGGVTPENEKIRKSIEYRLWREAVFARDNWTCQECEQKGGRLHSHHIKSFAKYPDLKFAIDNGQTLCKECHKLTDNYGRKSL